MAYRTLFVLRAFHADRGLFVDYPTAGGVTFGGNGFGFGLAARRAFSCLSAAFSAGCSFCGAPASEIVTRRLDDCLRLYHFAANVAMRTFGFTVGGAGCGDCLIYNFGVTFGRDNFCIGVAAVAGKCFFALFCAGGLFGY